ncbi:GGDEF domain-containing protein [Shewanella sedimentimangrovi]|uniref:GGDEF domain-containing protein n=1 Tax=Shewanella sedimentimangrovi TaxID=2814293 RepID=A0ABX7QZQ3_9GAMM|nr:GGDEF domain-containing protein [Shewanella sedimentimangrovi]QSX36401.1 GGDEF domain-containing protein [Shewanella sedimentimangrovi]
MSATLHLRDTWLTSQSHPAISLSRWQQHTELLCQLFKADTCLIVQHLDEQAHIVTVKQQQERWTAGETLPWDELLTAMKQGEPGEHPAWQDGLIALDLHWPDTQSFGQILIACKQQPAILDTCLKLAEPVRALIQAELKHMYLMQQLEMLSFQDEHTCMLNPYGFSLMAPRQLNLSRRLGSHAGIVLLENCQSSLSMDEQQTQLRKLARVVHENMREADLAARLENQQVVILAFVDNEANLQSLESRMKKQLLKTEPSLRVVTGYSFFSPDANIELDPMIAEANAKLQLEKQRLYPQ